MLTTQPNGPSANLRNVVYGAAQQFFGYRACAPMPRSRLMLAVPPTLVLDLQLTAEPFLTSHKSPKVVRSSVQKAFAKSFDAVGKSPAVVTCFETASSCVASAFAAGHHVDCDAVNQCRPLVT